MIDQLTSAPPAAVAVRRPPRPGGIHLRAVAGSDIAVGAAVAGAVVASARPTWHALAQVVLFCALQLLCLAAYGLYGDARRGASSASAGEAARLVAAVGSGAWLFALAAAALGTRTASVPRLGLAWALLVPSVAGARAAVRAAARALSGRERVLVVGAGRVGQALAEKLVAGGRADVVGFLDPSPRPAVADVFPHVPVYEHVEQLEQALAQTGATALVVAFSTIEEPVVAAAIEACDRLDVRVAVVPRLYDLVAQRPRLEHVGGIPLLALPRVGRTALDELAKRAADVVVAAILLLVLAPALAVVAAAIRVESPGPALFTQARVGRHGRIFRMAKFRTMRGVVEELDERLAPAAATAAIPPKPRVDPRVTPLGAWLRTTSLDELPQLWNVLRGEMSLVGPRPLPVYEFAATAIGGGIRLQVAPGMTGLWQVLGRSDIDFDERMRLDRLYARNRSLRWDLLLLLETLPAVLRRRGAY